MTNRLPHIMKTILLLAALFSTSAFAQEAYKCKTPSGFQYQDRPCKVGAPPERTPAPPVAAPVSDAQARLERDKRYLAERAQIRQKTEAREAVTQCENEALYLQSEVEQIAGSQTGGYASTLADMSKLQLMETRRQTRLAGAQSKVDAKRRECDDKRRTADGLK